MTREQLIKIAKAGFPSHILERIDFYNFEMFSMGGVYRLYDRRGGFKLMLPTTTYLSVFIGGHNFIQIDAGIRAFNHYTAIKEIERLGLIE